MSEVISTQLFSWAVYGVTLFIICLFTISRFQRLGRLCMQGIVGSSVIFIINCVLYQLNICLGINFITVGASAVLGMPGIGLMYLMLYIV